MFYWAWDITPASAVSLSYLFVKQKYVLKKVDFFQLLGTLMNKKGPCFEVNEVKKHPAGDFPLSLGGSNIFCLQGKPYYCFD